MIRRHYRKQLSDSKFQIHFMFNACLPLPGDEPG